ncbi:restriction endonuclease subunit S [Halalkalibacterium halodurans]|uniref:restriction endonuclease subunit S n=1 Tax=Halalkalibacterium halodurans TaxID=86665 RepID=UPI0010FCFCB6|nr:restriction endonuclease subunit S [Halalkalibacterium halodurans]
MYETVEDYKKTKFGLIPNDWIIKKGEGLSTKITKGASPKWQGFDYQDNGILFVTSENVREGVLDVTQPKFLPIEFGEKQKNSKLKKGDILINIVGASIGRSCEYDIDVEANINQAVCLFRTKSEADKSFIKYYLQSNSVKKRLLGTQTESARPNLSLTDIREFEFVLPKNDKEKLKIASILSTWDKAIELKEKLIEQKKEQKKGLMQKLLSGEVRLPGFDGEWKEVQLGAIAEIYQPKTISQSEMMESGYPVYGANGLIGYYDKFNHDQWQIMITCRGSTCGTVNRTSGKAWITGNAMVVNVDNSPNVDKDFMFYLCYIQKYDRIIGGSGQPQITKKPLEDFLVTIPSNINEQKAIAEICLLVE